MKYSDLQAVVVFDPATYSDLVEVYADQVTCSDLQEGEVFVGDYSLVSIRAPEAGDRSSFGERC